MARKTIHLSDERVLAFEKMLSSRVMRGEEKLSFSKGVSRLIVQAERNPELLEEVSLF